MEPNQPSTINYDLLRTAVELHQELRRFERRYDDLTAELHQSRSLAEQLRAQLADLLQQAQQTQSELLRLHEQLTHKQAAIRLLLPHYPHPLTPELRHQLAC